ncbi:autotransporter assembly complex protein TamA [Neisseriaceae bacterium ESL0693]|nr:autotransporter assembly complex protein TamA [Neisseriaceae bacterium ESL0693]
MTKRLHHIILIVLFHTISLSAWAEAIDQDNNEIKAKKDAKPGWFARLFPKKEQPKTPRIPVVIELENLTLHKMITQHLPLITQQQVEELDDEQIGFLADEAPEQIKTMLATEGYFNSQVDIQKQPHQYTITITPGPRTHVENVSVSLTGPVSQDDKLTEYYKDAINSWALPVGDPFTQNHWKTSKSSVLAAVVREKYPLASISASRAAINPVSNRADLSVTVDSKQPVYFGDIQVSGNQRYPLNVITGMAQFSTGMPYDLDKLLDYQQALEQDGHYASAIVQADFDHMQNDHVPVLVKVSEMKKQKFTMGLRYDSKNGPGIRTGYDYYNLFNRGYIGSTLLDSDRYETNFGFGLSQPRNSRGHYWTSSLNYKYSTVQHLQTRALSSGVWYVRDRNQMDSRLGVEYITESNSIEHGPDIGHAYATMLTASWRRQNIETQLHPLHGYYLEGKVGATLGKVASSAAMQRVTAQGGYYYTPENKKYGTWVMRSQMGYVHTQDDVNVPSTLMFRTGGATSVRGYEQDSIGIQASHDSVLPNRTLAVASVEYQIPVYKSFALALFHDAGSVSKGFSDMKWEHGSGLGVRWFSPVAPFAFDMAYGHHDKKWRWHLSLGTKF